MSIPNQLPGDPNLVSPPEVIKDLVTRGSEIRGLDVETFFRLPEKSNFKISPDGRHYAFIGPYKRRKNLYVVGTDADAQEKHLTKFEDRGLSGFAWANNRHIIFLKDAGGDEDFHLWIIDIETMNVDDLTPYEGVRVDILDILPDDDEHVLITMNKNNPQLFEPFRLNTHSGEMTQLAENEDVDAPIVGWITDNEGQLRLATRLINGVDTALLFRKQPDDDFREVIRTNYKTEIRPLFFDFDDMDIIWAASNLNRDKSALVTFDLESGKEVDVKFEHDQVDVGHAGYSRKRRCPTLVSYTTDKTRYHFLDEQRAEIQKKLESQLPGLEVAVVSSSKDENKLIVRTYSDRSLGAYYLYHVNDDLLSKIHGVSPWIDEDKMAIQRAISFSSRDGLQIHGYLTLPHRSEDGPVPIIVNPHGGPWHRDTWGFNPEVQLFASRGYGVLQINFRGSTGYGRAFWQAGFKQWGQAMQNDLTDGVQWLIDQGVAMKEKVAIYGGSYGGYATLAGVCFTPELYCCAIDYVGVSNLFSFMNTVPPYWEPYLKMMYEMVGHPEDDREMMAAYSPALHADKIKVPLFVIQGANDPRVNIDESDQMVRSLRERALMCPIWSNMMRAMVFTMKKIGSRYTRPCWDFSLSTFNPI